MAKDKITPDSMVQMEDVIASGLIPDLDPMFLQFTGKGWFKDGKTGTAYHFVKEEDGNLSIKATRQSKTSTKEALKAEPKPKVIREHVQKRVVITCCDCSALREVNVQDAFQVKRCEACQKKYRQAKRAERIKRKRAEAKANKGV